MHSERNDWFGRKFLVDTIWPEHTMHVISGSSGTWKTSFLFTLLREFEQGRPVLGYESHPCPWVYVAFDRDLGETWDTLGTVRYNPDASRIYSVYDNWKHQQNYTGVIQSMPRLLPKGGLMVIDGLQMLYGSGGTNDYNLVANFIRSLRMAAKAHNITLLGLCHNAKAKQGEEYAHPRDKIMGSVAWGATVGTVLALENKTDTDKTLWVCPRLAKEYQLTLSREKNGMIYVRDEDDDTKSALVLNTRLMELVEGNEIDRATIMMWALESNISEATADRWLTKQIGKKGRLERVGRGKYRKMSTN